MQTSMVRLRKDTIAQYRRIRTPLFYINLKPRIFSRFEYKTRHFPATLFTPGFFLPPGHEMTIKGWKDAKGKLVDTDLCKRLDIINSQPHDNVIRLQA